MSQSVVGMVSQKAYGISFGSEKGDLLRAFAYSLLLHGLLFGLLELGHFFGWWRLSPLSVLSNSRDSKAVPLLTATAKLPPKEREIPLTFVEVDPETAVKEQPRNPEYYSALSSRAANPDPENAASAPKIDGEQTRIVKTFDTILPQPAILSQPDPVRPEPPNPAPPQPAPRPESAAPPKPESLAAVEPSLQPKPAKDDDRSGFKPEVSPSANSPSEENPNQIGSPPPSPKPKYRTLAQARIAKGIQVSPKMKQEGGVEHRGKVALDVKGTVFGAYDAALVYAVQQRWYHLLQERNFSGERTGKVVLEFRLHANGRVTHARIAENDVGDFLALLCQKGVEDNSPYEEWPSDMRRMNRSDHREMRFTFYYN